MAQPEVSSIIFDREGEWIRYAIQIAFSIWVTGRRLAVTMLVGILHGACVGVAEAEDN